MILVHENFASVMRSFIPVEAERAGKGMAPSLPKADAIRECRVCERRREPEAPEAGAQGLREIRSDQKTEAVKPSRTHMLQRQGDREWAEPRTNPSRLGPLLTECHPHCQAPQEGSARGLGGQGRCHACTCTHIWSIKQT